MNSTSARRARRNHGPAFGPARLVALLAAIALVLTGAVVFAAPAAAATKAYGFQGGTGAASGWLGNVSTHGILADCIDEAGFFPSGTTTANGYIGDISATSASADPGHNGTSAVSGADMQKLNYALSVYGQAATSDTKAAALEAYVYSITSSLYPGDDVKTIIDTRVTDSTDAANVYSSYLSIKADVNAHYASPVQKNKATVVVNMDPVPALTGTVTITATPASATGTMTLTGGVVTATGLTTTAVSNGDVIPITATADSSGDLYNVTANVSFTAPTTYSKDLYEYTTDSPTYAQRVVTGGKLSNATFTASGNAFDPVAPQFEPVVTTAVSDTSVEPGAPVTDQVTATVSDPTQPWTKNLAGDYYPVVARGTLYCGMDAFPTNGEAPPPEAVAEGPEFLTLNGPGTYTTDGSLSCPSSGYATWVWSILDSDQSPLTQEQLPTDYSWSDTFGDAPENAYARASVSATTQVSPATVGLQQPTSDVVTVDQASGVWPTDSTGAAINVEFDGTAYWVPGDTAPTQSSTVPADAVSFATGTITATAAGDYPGPVVTAPYNTDGYVVWQWTTAGGDYTDPWTEDFAEPTQIVQVTAPTMTSTADATTAFTDTSSDSVTVVGPDMGAAANLTWDAYLQPAGSPAVCDPGTQVFDSSADPVEVTTAGTYTVPTPPQLPATGTYLWVATLAAQDGTVIAQGTCGDPAETTDVVSFSLVTTATAIAPAGSGVTDTATLTGPVPTGATLSFSAYKETSSTAVCDSTTVAYTSPAIALRAAGKFTSPSVELPKGNYAWVATAFDRDGNVLQADTCGVAAESTHVMTVLAYTGSVIGLVGPWVGGGLLIVGSLLLAAWQFVLWRRRRTAVGADIATGESM